jgi:hypothetical protein
MLREIRNCQILAFRNFRMFGSLKESSMCDKKSESDQRAQRYVPRLLLLLLLLQKLWNSFKRVCL